MFAQVTGPRAPSLVVADSSPIGAMSFLLSAHALLVAAIFTLYMGSMTAFGAYIIRTGRHEDREPRHESGDGDGDQDGLLAAA